MKFVNLLEDLESKYKNIKKCIIIGDPVEHSLSPVMHNKGYESLGIDNQYIFDKINVKEEELDEFINDLKIINEKYKSFVGLTCTMPHKINIIKYLDKINEEAKIIGAVNSVLFNGKEYIGYNTDWFGIEYPFVKRNIELKNKKVAILGAGGASRSAIYTFKKNNSVISVFNRTKEKADRLAKEFDIFSFGLDNKEELKKNDVIVNMTNVGMKELESLSPISEGILDKNKIVFECIYKPKETKLIKDALNNSAEVVYGWEMLLYQGVKQFEIYTGLKTKDEILRSVL